MTQVGSKQNWSEFHPDDLVGLYRGGWIDAADVRAASAGGIIGQVEGLSPDDILELAQHYGGGAHYVPMRPLQGHPLCRLLSQASVEALTRSLGGDIIGIPRLDSLRQVARNRFIRAMRRQGLPAKKIAAHLGITERHVYRVLARTQEA